MDVAEIRRVVLALANPLVEEKSDTSQSPSPKSALEELSRYAIKNWQPVNTSVELTYLCNQRCKPCYLNNFRARGMSRKRINEIAEELKEAGVIFILLTGGETFLRSDALDIMEDLEKKGFVIEIKTNGTIFGPKTIERLIYLHPIDIQVSIYAIEDGYSDLTGSRYRFSHIQENVKGLLKGKLPVTLSVLVGKHNIDKIERIHEVLVDIGAEIFYSPYITPNRGDARQGIDFRLSRRELEEKFRPFLEKIRAFPIPKKYRDCKRESTVCFAGRDQISIDPFGRVYPCLDLRVSLGDLSRESLSKILARRKTVLQPFTLEEMIQCRGCAIRDYCDSCIGLALTENGDYRIPSPHKCDVSQFYVSERRW